MIKPEWKAEKALIGYSSQNVLSWKVNKRLTYIIREHVPLMSAGAPRPFILGIVIYDQLVPMVDSILSRFTTIAEAQAYAAIFHKDLIS